LARGVQLWRAELAEKFMGILQDENKEAQIQISISLRHSSKCGNRFSKSRVKSPIFSVELIVKSARWQNFACPLNHKCDLAAK
jgi:hypothetical protein